MPSSRATFSRSAKNGDESCRIRLKLNCALFVSLAVMFRDHARLALMPRPEPESVKPKRFGDTVLLPWYPRPALRRFFEPIRMLETRELTLCELFKPVHAVS